MGKKRVICEFNDGNNNTGGNDKLNNVGFDDHHHHQHHHRHHNDHHHHHHRHEKSKKMKPEAKLLHTLNSHFKKLAKSRTRNPRNLSLSSSSLPKSTINAASSKPDKDHHPRTPPCMAMHGSQSSISSSCSSSTRHEDYNDRVTDTDSDKFFFGGDQECGEMGVFKFGQEIFCSTTSFLGSEENEDLFGGNCSFAPDLNASHDLVVVVDGVVGSGFGPCIPDPIVDMNADDDGFKYLSDMLELSSQEDMLNEFVKVDLFFS